ncbi:MAG: hypothetical protein CMG22_03250 [Candidatus Marinimicrobia bacterium]|nr:hypothetical protein [Candidatus Neomarinimicrobiota bacterium]
MKIFLLSTFYTICLIVGQEPQKDSASFVFDPPSLRINFGETAKVNIKLIDQKQELVNIPFTIYSANDPGIGPTPDWPGTSINIVPRVSDDSGNALVTVQPKRSGKLLLKVRSTSGIVGEMVIDVPKPPINQLVFSKTPSKLYVGTLTQFTVKVFDKAKVLRDDTDYVLKSSDTSIADFDNFGNLKTKKAGRLTVSAKAGDKIEKFKVRIVKNPVRSLSLNFEQEQIRTGDVLHLKVNALNGAGRIVRDAPIRFSFSGQADYGEYGLPASGLVTEDGRFVAETAGLYTITASSGVFSDQKTLRVVPRAVEKDVRLIGHGLVSDVKSGDLWVWAGVGKHKGKDFAATGSIFGNGEAYFWDVSDPANMKIIDTVTVDARNVNDIKVSTDGRVGIISREGASNRKNGFVILDVSDPYNVTIISLFNDDMTGGVHNTFLYENHVYAVNNGRKYDIINIEDPKNPFRVGVFELDTPGHALHDVWIENGIAYSSNWKDGVVAVDVGGLKFSEKDRSDVKFNPLLMKSGKGSPSNPVKLASFPDRKGRNHSAFPFLSQTTGDFYIIAGDEVFPNGLENLLNNKPSSPRGGFHFMNFNDTDNPKEDAVYLVPEAGSHNQWVYNDILYAAFYQAGVRILDISGELLGDLYKQGREIGYFLPKHREGIIPNAPMVWGAQPYKNYIFLSDMNSGLYCIELVDKNET